MLMQKPNNMSRRKSDLWTSIFLATRESDGNKYKVEVVLNVPDQVIRAEDSTVNVLAAVDIVEQKLATQLKKYKSSRMPHVGKRSVINRLKRRVFN